MVVTVGFIDEYEVICGMIEIEERDTQHLKYEKFEYVKTEQCGATRTGKYNISTEKFYEYLKEHGYEFSIIEEFTQDDSMDFSEEFYV